MYNYVLCSWFRAYNKHDDKLLKMFMVQIIKQKYVLWNLLQLKQGNLTHNKHM